MEIISQLERFVTKLTSVSKQADAAPRLGATWLMSHEGEAFLRVQSATDRRLPSFLYI